MVMPELIEAVILENLAKVRELLETGSPVNVRDAQLMTPLHWAAHKGNWDMAFLLLSHYADVFARDDCGWTPLHDAAFHGHVVIIPPLLTWMADISAKTTQVGAYYEYTPLHLAAEKGHTAAAQMLIDRGADVLTAAPDGNTPEDVAIAAGHLQTAAVINAGALRRDMCMAFAMGHHPRIGEASRVLPLEIGVVKMILSYV
jgi:ankyrin repeat protein